MNLPAKAVLGGLSLIAVSGTGLWVFKNNDEPVGHTLTEDEVKVYIGKFGGDFQHHMVSTENTNNGPWWSWIFENRWKKDTKESKNSEFSNLDGWSKLKEKCKESYDKTTKTDMRKKEKLNYEKTVWRYCSLEGQVPITVKEDKEEVYDSGKIGKDNESDLVSTKSGENDKFWEIQEKAFFKNKDKAGLGSKASKGSEFSDLYKKEPTWNSLRNICKDVYNKAQSSKPPNKKDALLFCSLKPNKK